MKYVLSALVALLLAAASAAAAAPQPGPPVFTPQQRAGVDARRKGGRADQPARGTTPSPAKAPTAARPN